MDLFVSSCLSSFQDLSIVGIVGQAIVASLAFIPPPNGVPFWWGHSAVLGKSLGLLVFLGLLAQAEIFPIPPLKSTSALAHEIEISGDVAATFHLEPNHNPRAGETAKVWFALTRRGGQIIPLEQCNCSLAVYPKGHKQGDKPLMEPPLKAVSAERYKGIPGADIVFPKAGIYELKLGGSAKTAANFKPFELTYTVTVR
jgi:hypothetical protein